MSKLRANDNNEKKNYFSNTEQVYELIKMLLQEFYSKEISDVGLDLLYNGASTLFEIQSRLKLSFENVRNYLIIMLQNNLIQKKIMARNEIKYNLYELKDEQILNILLFPRTLNFMEKKYGNYGRMIFEQFIGFGILTLKQIIEQIQNDQKNDKGTTFELIKTQVVDLFIQLYEDNFIIYSERANEDENYYSPNNKINNLSGNKEEKKKNTKKDDKKATDKKEKKGKSNKKKKNEKENTKQQKNIKLDEDEEEDDGPLNSSQLSSGEKEVIKNKKEEFYENNTKNNIHFYINFEQILAEFKSEIIIDYINNSISYEAGLLTGILLKKHKISSFMLGMTTPMSFAEIIKSYNSLSLSKIEEIVKNNDEIFNKSGSEYICLNIDKIKKEIKSRNIQNLIITKFSNEHFRVYNLLKLVGALDSKNIMNICLLVPKKINYITNQLLQEGFIQANNINIFENNNTLFYSVDEYQTAETIIEIDFKLINNYKLYYNEQLKSIKSEFRDKKKQNEDLMKLTYIIDQICENILIMKFF